MGLGQSVDGQSCKRFGIVHYESRVVVTRPSPGFNVTLEFRVIIYIRRPLVSLDWTLAN